MKQQFASFPLIETAIIEQREMLDRLAPPRGPNGRRVDLLLDEWGVWDRMDPEEEKKYGRLFQQITMRSAVAGALGLNVIHRQADKLAMTNIAQIVNVLHSLLLTDEDKCVRTTTYWVYEMTKPHLGQTSLPVQSKEVSASASRKEKDLTITLVNPAHDQTYTVACSLNGGSATGATGRVLHDNDLNAANTFATPDRIMPQQLKVDAQGGTVKVELPPLAVATVLVKLA
jgi:alpha-N-arabinofuranosidase